LDTERIVDGKHVICYEDQTRSIFSKPLSDEEKKLLCEVLNTLGQFSGLDNFSWLDDLQARLNDNQSFGKRNIDADVDTRKIISFSTNEELKNKDYLAGLFSAISNRRVVTVEYLKFGQTKNSKITLYPYLLKQFNDRWYLIGTPLGDKKFPFRPEFLINLPLDRIESYKEVPGKEYLDYPGDIDAHFDDIIGVTYYENEEKETIIFAITNDDAPYIRTKKIHWTQEECSIDEQKEYHQKYPLLKSYSFFTITCIPNYELRRLLSGFGRKLVVLSPKSLVDKIYEDLEAQFEAYSNNR
jgi:predicted DNA-binding transcriptional regulator YafY